MSLGVFSLTGYAWDHLGGLLNGMNTYDALDGNAANDPDGSTDILLVGLDSRTDTNGNPLDPKVLASLHAGGNEGELNTDTMILVHVPNNGKKATAMSLPRDSYVQLADGYGKHKLNSAYIRAKNDKITELKKKGGLSSAQIDVQSNQAGMHELIDSVQDLTGVTINHFAQVNLAGFADISNAVGGVPVCLKHAVDDTTYSGFKHAAGTFTVQGLSALQFVRQRHNIPGGSTDLQRERRQQAFLASMTHKVLSAGTLSNGTELNNLVDAVQKSVVVDPDWNLLQFAQQMQGMTSGDLSFNTIPTENIDYQTPEDGSAIEVDPAAVKKFVQGETGGGSTSQSPPDSSSASNSSDSTGNGITVDVRNGSQRDGLAANVLNELVKQGFAKGNASNANPRHNSMIEYPSGHKNDADKVSDALGGGYSESQDDNVPNGHVWVFLGSVYHGPGAQDFAGAAQILPNGPVVHDDSGDAAGSSSSSNSPSLPPISQSGDSPPCVD
ncbi:MAG: LCP family protein [Sciscionella sp.]|nr:LCP family protein [Sciscionella sp.]